MMICNAWKYHGIGKKIRCRTSRAWQYANTKGGKALAITVTDDDAKRSRKFLEIWQKPQRKIKLAVLQLCYMFHEVSRSS
jgi:hypothetical protein